jgi:hypothetical protein
VLQAQQALKESKEQLDRQARKVQQDLQARKAQQVLKVYKVTLVQLEQQVRKDLLE